MSEPTWLERTNTNVALKRAAAAACLRANLVKPFHHVFVDCGTTFVHLAEEILDAAKGTPGIILSTTNAEVVELCMAHAQRDLVDLRVLGGQYIGNHRAFDGDHVTFPEGNGKIFDWVFLGVSQLDHDYRVLSTITDVVTVKQKVLAQASEVVLLCDESKFAPAPPDRRHVGRLVHSTSGEMVLLVETTDIWIEVPARVVVGVSERERPAGLSRLIAEFGSVDPTVILVAPALQEVET